MVSRGIRNNNPGNIDKGQSWEGLADDQPDPRFCTFVSPEYGIRAIHKILQSYQSKYGLDTVDGIISRWAPPSENDTVSYINDVSKRCALMPSDHIEVMAPDIAQALVKGIIFHENAGYEYPEEVIWKGLQLAGVQV